MINVFLVGGVTAVHMSPAATRQTKKHHPISEQFIMPRIFFISWHIYIYRPWIRLCTWHYTYWRSEAGKHNGVTVVWICFKEFKPLQIHSNVLVHGSFPVTKKNMLPTWSHSGSGLLSHPPLTFCCLPTSKRTAVSQVTFSTGEPSWPRPALIADAVACTLSSDMPPRDFTTKQHISLGHDVQSLHQRLCFPSIYISLCTFSFRFSHILYHLYVPSNDCDTKVEHKEVRATPIGLLSMPCFLIVFSLANYMLWRFWTCDGKHFIK